MKKLAGFLFEMKDIGLRNWPKFQKFLIVSNKALKRQHEFCTLKIVLTRNRRILFVPAENYLVLLWSFLNFTNAILKRFLTPCSAH